MLSRDEIFYRFVKLSGEKLDHVIEGIVNNGEAIKKVSLINCSLGVNEAELKRSDIVKLVTTLEILPSLSELDLSSNYIYSDGAEIIARSLPSLKNLRVLKLSDNGIKAGGIKKLIDAATALPNTLKLIVDKNNLSLAEYQELINYARRNPKIELTVSTIKETLECKKALTQFEFKAVVHELSISPIKKIKLAGSGLGSSEIKDLVDVIEANQLFFLEELDLSENKITDVESIVNLVNKIPNLRVNLAGNPIPPKDIEYKDLSGDKYKELFVKLKVYPVRKIKLVGCGISNYEVEQLIEVIEKNQITTLAELDLSENKITDVGANRLFDLLRKYPHLRINLAGNQITSQELEYKDVSGSKFNEMMAKLQIYPVAKLKLADCMLRDDAVKKIIDLIATNHFSTLRDLDLSGNRLTAVGAGIVLDLAQRLPSLQVNLAGNLITPLELEYKESGKFNETIAKLNIYPVTKLKLADCSLRDDEIKKIIDLIAKKQSATLKELDVSGNRISAENESALLDLMKKCPHLKIQLSAQELEYNRDLSGERLNEVINKLSLYPITKLKMADCKLGDAEIKQLAEVIEKRQSLVLKELNLTHNLITNEGAITLSRVCLGLKLLDLSGNKIGDSGARAIAESLNLRKLVTLNLSDNTIFAEGIDAIKKVASNHATLSKVDLSGNSVDEDDEFEDQVEEVLSDVVEPKRDEAKMGPSVKVSQRSALFGSSVSASGVVRAITKLDLGTKTVEDDFILLGSDSFSPSPRKS